MSKLPSGLPEVLQVHRNIAHLNSTYEICLRLEKRIQADINAVDTDARNRQDDLERDIIFCRILGYLLHHAPTLRALHTVSKGIVSCSEDRTSLVRLGKVYYDHLLRAFRLNRGNWQTQTPSDEEDADAFPLPRAHFGTLANMIEEWFPGEGHGPQNLTHSMAKKRVSPIQPLMIQPRRQDFSMRVQVINVSNQSFIITFIKALVRDGFRCAVTGGYDAPSVDANRELDAKVEVEFEAKGPLRGRYRHHDHGVALVYTRCVHILSESLFQSTNNRDVGNIVNAREARLELESNTSESVSFRSILTSFGYDHLFEELNGTNVHRLENVITLEPDLHQAFDTLEIWFTPTGDPHRYKLEGRWLPFASQFPQYFTFTTNKPELPLPSRNYLALHATCAKVTHLSGAGAYIDKALRDLEEIRELAEDGGSARLFEDALFDMGSPSWC
ncbi:hypothetical protein BJ138DRAFT_1157359 [Hygrophoropsis aurantiaca]|uniref:Uncharacterized protein n=1 Tax=Hygrophoropsis aurantiaca TaxID=72124 RepID=A0ACB8A6A9_9AGAM|nr:hypothetical protein BJ138DRAFT_1157359 [Hygrophoropsis aurantiaca]